MPPPLVEYLWVSTNNILRSKVKILEENKNYSVENIPIWNYDGSSTRQATVEQSELILRPVQLYTHPFYNGGFLVFCEVYVQHEDGRLLAHTSNYRYKVQELFNSYDDYAPWYGIEQEYYILDGPKNNASHYCGNGPQMVGRKFAEQHLLACLRSGLKISGINAEQGPGQWEYQIGPVKGIEAADQLWVSRFILQRLAEETGLQISLHPKPYPDRPGSGCHINFSTLQMRLPGGYQSILNCIEKLKTNHNEYLKWCGEDVNKRLTGEHSTSLMISCSIGVGNRSTSIRIPVETHLKQCGYFEDRRPNSNADPFMLCNFLLKAAVEE